MKSSTCLISLDTRICGCLTSREGWKENIILQISTCHIEAWDSHPQLTKQQTLKLKLEKITFIFFFISSTKVEGHIIQSFHNQTYFLSFFCLIIGKIKDIPPMGPMCVLML
jgi:hypothetical protein